MSTNIIEELYAVLQSRKNSDSQTSYVASLYEGGASKISEKIREEAEEVIVEALALENSDEQSIRDNLTNEAADLIFHLWVMLAHHNVTPKDVGDILKKRFGTSGHIEKASR